jgi:hypothetical protein
LLCAAPAHAQGTVRFLSSFGDDANNCTRAQPCRSLQRGIATTPSNGELQIVDSGRFGGNVVINKSITISGEGIAAQLGTVTINASDAVVVLRGLLFNGRGSDVSGVIVVAAAAVHIVRCEIERFPQNGIFLASGSNSDVFVTDTISRDNTFGGLQVKGPSTGQLTIDNSRFVGNGNGGVLVDRVDATLTRVVSARNTGDGIQQTGGRINVSWTTTADNSADGFSVGAGGAMVLESSVARGNAANGLVNSGGTAVISNSTFTHNSTGVNTNNGGITRTRQNNTVQGNTTIDQFGPLTPLGAL